MRIGTLVGALLVATALPVVASAQPATTPQCPFTADELKAQLGQPFKAGVPESGIIGKACTYTANGIKLWIDAGPAPMPAAQWRKMSSAPGTTWKPVAGDPDNAVHEVLPPGNGMAPSLSYERKGWLVKLVVTGVDGKGSVDAWNAKLVKLRRIP